MQGIDISLHHRLGDFELNIDVQLPATGVCALFGHSGSGKTSILRSIAGLNRFQGTRIRFNRHTWQDEHVFVPPHQRAVGYVFQESSLFPHLSVHDNLLYGYRRLAAAQRNIHLQDIAALLGLDNLFQRPVSSLSGGERQRIAIGRALLSNPLLLLMDEPLSALDHKAREGIYPYLETLHDELSILVVYVSHDPYEVARLADRLVIIEQGRLKAEGSCKELLSRLDLPMAQFDNATSIIEGRVAAHDEEFALTTIATAGGNFTTPRLDLPANRLVRIEIQARDVSLSRQHHNDTSIINILPVRVLQTREINTSQVLVRLALQDDQVLLSRITRRSAVALDLHPGLQLFAQVKSVALLN